MHNGTPVILLCGDGGSGKDTVAKLLSFHWKLPYFDSTSWTAALKMYEQVREGLFSKRVRGVSDSLCPYPRMEHYDLSPTEFSSVDEFYNKRSAYRRFWADWIDCYNASHSTQCRLYLECIAAGNHILTGIRKVREFQAFMSTKIPDLAIWVDRPGVPRDPTQEYGPECCNLVLRNGGSEGDLKLNMMFLGRFMEHMADHWDSQPN